MDGAAPAEFSASSAATAASSTDSTSASSTAKLKFRTRRDDRATAAARRTFKFGADE
jgi:hypothetical protein